MHGVIWVGHDCFVSCAFGFPQLFSAQATTLAFGLARHVVVVLVGRAMVDLCPWRDDTETGQQSGTPAQAGTDRHDDDVEVDDQWGRRAHYPRWKHKPSQGPRGHGAGGSQFGWDKDSACEEMPSWWIMSFLVQADLSQASDRRRALQEKAKADFDCIVGWRKDRHSEDNMPLPYRVQSDAQSDAQGQSDAAQEGDAAGRLDRRSIQQRSSGSL